MVFSFVVFPAVCVHHCIGAPMHATPVRDSDRPSCGTHPYTSTAPTPGAATTPARTAHPARRAGSPPTRTSAPCPAARAPGQRDMTGTSAERRTRTNPTPCCGAGGASTPPPAPPRTTRTPHQNAPPTTHGPDPPACRGPGPYGGCYALARRVVIAGPTPAPARAQKAVHAPPSRDSSGRPHSRFAARCAAS